MEPCNEDINAKKIISVEEDPNYEVAKSKAGGFQACQDSNPDLCARGGGGGGTPGNSWWGGGCRRVLKILTLFQNKKCHFPDPFSDLAFRQKLCKYNT